MPFVHDLVLKDLDLSYTLNLVYQSQTTNKMTFTDDIKNMGYQGVSKENLKGTLRVTSSGLQEVVKGNLEVDLDWKGTWRGTSNGTSNRIGQVKVGSGLVQV